MVLSKNYEEAVHYVLQIIIAHYNADRSYIFEFDWEHNVTNNTFEICKEGVSKEIENLQNVPIDVVKLWIDIFKNQNRKVNIIEDIEKLKDIPERR